jgi:hypothetical protein
MSVPAHESINQNHRATLRRHGLPGGYKAESARKNARIPPRSPAPTAGVFTFIWMFLSDIPAEEGRELLSTRGNGPVGSPCIRPTFNPSKLSNKLVWITRVTLPFDCASGSRENLRRAQPIHPAREIRTSASLRKVATSCYAHVIGIHASSESQRRRPPAPTCRQERTDAVSIGRDCLTTQQSVLQTQQRRHEKGLG